MWKKKPNKKTRATKEKDTKMKKHEKNTRGPEHKRLS